MFISENDFAAVGRTSPEGGEKIYLRVREKEAPIVPDDFTSSCTFGSWLPGDERLTVVEHLALNLLSVRFRLRQVGAMNER